MTVAELVSRVLEIPPKRIYGNLTYNQRFRVAVLISFYSRGNLNALLLIVNHLLDFDGWASVYLGKIKPAIGQVLDATSGKYVSKPAFRSIEENHAQIRVLSEMEAQQNLLVLLALVERLNFFVEPLLKESPETHIREIVSIFTAIGKEVVLVIDSLDECTSFFEGTNPFLESLQTFINSILDDSFLTLTHYKPLHFNILYFLPSIPNLKIPQNTHKIPFKTITWNARLLENYADATLECLRKLQKNYCAVLPTFAQLLGSSQIKNELLAKLRHPRGLLSFIASLMDELNKFSRIRPDAFVAIPEDVWTALENAEKSAVQT